MATHLWSKLCKIWIDFYNFILFALLEAGRNFLHIYEKMPTSPKYRTYATMWKWNVTRFKSDEFGGHMSGTVKSGVVHRSSSVVSRAQWAGVLFCWKVKWRHVYVKYKISNETAYLQRAFIPVSRYLNIIKIRQDFPKLWPPMYCHLFYRSHYTVQVRGTVILSGWEGNSRPIVESNGSLPPGLSLSV